jgi:hypothetical protein
LNYSCVVCSWMREWALNLCFEFSKIFELNGCLNYSFVVCLSIIVSSQNVCFGMEQNIWIESCYEIFIQPMVHWNKLIQHILLMPVKYLKRTVETSSKLYQQRLSIVFYHISYLLGTMTVTTNVRHRSSSTSDKAMTEHFIFYSSIFFSSLSKFSASFFFSLK